MLRQLYYLKAFGYEFLEKAPPKLKARKKFDELLLEVCNCHLCGFSKKRLYPLMQKQIYKHTKLMIISTFASKSENESGKLLCSSSGNKLKDLLKKHLQIQACELYISYIFKCFSAGKNDEFAAHCCIPYLFDELALVEPKIILCLGELSFKYLGFDDFSSWRGELMRFENSILIPSFDMDFILKNPSFEPEFIKDLTKIKGIL